MKKIIYISTIALVCILFIVSCKKTNVDKYPSNSIALTTSTESGAKIIKWNKINTSDFIAYQVFASSKSEIDVTKDVNKIVATITDFEVNTFKIDDVLIDSFLTNNKIFYKVAAVLPSRKIGSNILETSSNIIYSGTSASLVANFQEMGKVLISDGGFGGSITEIDILNNKATILNNAQLPLANYILSCGKNENGNYRVLGINGNNSLAVFNLDNKTLEQTFFTNNSFFTACLINGYIITSDYGSSSYLLQAHKLSDFSVVSTVAAGTNYYSLVPS